MRTPALSDEAKANLKYALFHQQSALLFKRFLCVWLYFKLGEKKAVAQLLDISRNSVASYIRCYETGGIEALSEVGYRRKRSALYDFQAVLEASLEQQPAHTVAEAKDRIRQLTGLVRGLTQVRRFLTQLGFKPRKMGHIPAKANPDKQAEFLQTTLEPLIEKAHKQQVVLLFMDAAHFILQPFVTAVWSKIRLFLPAAAGRNRINVLGALNAISLDVTVLTNHDYINAQTICDFLAQVHRQYQALKIPIYIVLDNARYQHCQLVQERATMLGITLCFLPPYSPNLNLIERLWKFIKKQVLYGKYYSTVTEFHRAIEGFVRNLSPHQHKLKSLLTLHFQTLTHALLSSA
jgi:transposase